jgi:methyl-accepting chemotaxis protein
MKGKAVNQSQGVARTNAAIEEVMGGITALNTSIEEQSESISRSSAAVEQMVANIASITHTLSKNQQNVESLASASEKGSKGLNEVSADIQGVAKESEGLLEINAVIQSIATQTNLLAMNAAIEAAHAGESGKGFAVVADEIRKLAESSSSQAKSVSVVLKKMKESLDKISKSTTTVIGHFQNIDQAVQVVTIQERNIKNAVEEQDVGSKEILETVAKLQDITRDVRVRSTEMLSGSKKVQDEGRTLDLLTADIMSGMGEIALGVQQINQAVTGINEISRNNKQSIDILMQDITRFKVEADAV